MITIEEFQKIELIIGTVRAAERVEKSDKLLKLTVDLGEANLPAGRQVIAGIGKAYEPETLIGKQVVIVANLAPRTLMGLESQGMLLAVAGETPTILTPEKEVAAGTHIR